MKGEKHLTPKDITLITIANMCERLQCLPAAGGLLDQDFYLVLGMQLVYQVQGEKREKERKDAARNKGRARPNSR